MAGHETGGGGVVRELLGAIKQGVVGRSPVGLALPSVDDEESWLATYASTSPGLASLLQRMSSVKARRTLSEIRSQREFHRDRRLTRIAALQLKRSKLQGVLSRTKALIDLRDSLYLRRLEQQRESAERRLQELLFECLGEYEKARLRALRRSQYLGASVDSQLDDCVSTMHWAQFLVRAEDEVQGSLVLQNIDPTKDYSDFSDLSRFLTALLLKDQRCPAGSTIAVKRIVQIRCRGAGRRRNRGEAQNQVGRACSGAEEALALLLSPAPPPSSRLRNPRDPKDSKDAGQASDGSADGGGGAGAHAAPPYPPGTVPRPNFSRTMMMSAKCLLWLLMPVWAGEQYQALKAKEPPADLPPGIEPPAIGAPNSTVPAVEVPLQLQRVKVVNCLIYFRLSFGPHEAKEPSASANLNLGDRVAASYSARASAAQAGGAEQPYTADTQLRVKGSHNAHRNPKVMANALNKSQEDDELQSYPDVLEVFPDPPCPSSLEPPSSPRSGVPCPQPPTRYPWPWLQVEARFPDFRGTGTMFFGPATLQELLRTREALQIGMGDARSQV